MFRSDHRFRLSVGAHETAVVQLRRVRVTVLSKSEGREGPGQPGGQGSPGTRPWPGARAGSALPRTGERRRLIAWARRAEAIEASR